MSDIDRDRSRAAAVASGREAVGRALQAGDQTERMLLMVKAVQDAVADMHLRPVVVGGLAVEYYVHAYSTSDIDVLLPTSHEVERRLRALGFRQAVTGSRVWDHPEGGVEWEMPGSVLGRLDQTVEIELPDHGQILMLRCEDILVHRIEEFVGTGHADAFEQALALLQYPQLDMRRVRERAAAVNHEHAVDALLQELRRVDAGNPMPETWDLHALAERLGSEWLRQNRDGL